MPRYGVWDYDPYESENPPARDYYDPPEATVQTDAGPQSAPLPEDDYGSFDLPTYSGGMSPSFNFEGAPEFDAPEFYAPSFEDAQNEPGYQFRLRSGSDAMERSAAARGVLRTGGTLKGLQEYGQNFGAQEYSNVYDRAMRTYGTRLDALKSEYAPRLAEWQARFGAEQARGLAGFEREWLQYQAQLENQRFMEQLRNQVLTAPPPTFPTTGG